ncbi:TolC family protein [Xylanibacter ruminicola]|uniref:Outer membrane protein n=1 Tax=Xylanibacter ruminicola TaxID=839 RepID=A0A1M6TGW4_XYLRU|nr:TolC family protein [Xylanibacter ruminicola]SHK56272.1 outer membrane protein [Xylanibacter ruminicola]
MKRISIVLCASAVLCFTTAQAQQWTMWQCMQYAVEHNHDVKRAELELDNYKAQKTGAIGSFLPYVDAGIGAQYNFGRAIDPETNTYTDVSTFYNGYQLSASLPVFDGFNRLHALKAAQASVLMGQSALRQRQNLTALDVLQAYTNVAYYEGLVKMANEKVEETMLLLKQTKVLEEVGRKSAADVAQVESQQAEADYELTRQQNLYASAMLELKKTMGYPLNDSLSTTLDYGNRILGQAKRQSRATNPTEQLNMTEQHPELLASRYQMLASKHEWRQARASLLPALSLSAGLNTTYYKTLQSETAASFSSQFKNNMGEYVGATLSIPLFNRLQSITNIRKAKNNYKMAREAYEQKLLELEKLSCEAWQDLQGYLKQTAQMTHKVEADSIAYQLTRRQYEEGLSTAIDLRTTSAQLLNSKATLLQCQLMAMVKEQLVRYYNGETIWTE